MKNIINATLVIYAIRRANSCIPLEYAKLLYILVLSPVMLYQALSRNDVIAHRYRKFLMSLTFPEAVIGKDYKFSGCDDLHYKDALQVDDDRTSNVGTLDVNDETVSFCSTKLFTSLQNIIGKISSIYRNLYVAHGLVMFLVFRLVEKRWMNFTERKLLLQKEVNSWTRSCAFLIGQVVLQRFLLCIATRNCVFETKKHQSSPLSRSSSSTLSTNSDQRTRIEQVNGDVLLVQEPLGSESLTFKGKTLLAFVSALSSLPVLFERNYRVSQMNAFVTSHVVIGSLKKGKLFYWLPCYAAFIATLLQDRLRIDWSKYAASVVTAISMASD